VGKKISLIALALLLLLGNGFGDITYAATAHELPPTQVSLWGGWPVITKAQFEEGVLNQVETLSGATHPCDVKLSLVPNFIASDNSEQSVKGTTPTLVKTLTFTKSSSSYSEITINSNLRVDDKKKIAYSDIRVDDVSKFTHSTQSTTYVSYTDTLDLSGYADGEHTIELYLYTDDDKKTAYNCLLALYHSMVASDNSEQSTTNTDFTLLKTLTFTKSGASYDELTIAYNLKNGGGGNDWAYSDIRVDDASQFTQETQSTTYVSYTDTLDFSEYADGEYAIKLYLKASGGGGAKACNSIFALYRTKTYASSGTIASKVYDTGKDGASWDGLGWSQTLPLGTNITFEVRVSDTLFAKTDAIPTWQNASALPITGRYQQWRATLTTSDTSKTPVLHEVRVLYH
jgi:hypothetical protein